MTEMDDKVKKAVSAYKAGRKSEARDLLMEIVDADDKNEQGWLYLSLVVDSKQEQQICLENVLAINPNNKQARKALEVLNQKLGVPPPPPPPAPSAKPSVSSFAAPAPDDNNTISSWGDIDTSGGFDDWSASSPAPSTPATPPTPPPTPAPAAPTGDASGWFDDMDSPWQADANDPALSGDVGFEAASPPPATPAPTSSTSVEWSNPSADTGYTYGRTGTESEEFSDNELDSWISDMGIGVGGGDSAFDAPAAPASNTGSDLFAGASSSSSAAPASSGGFDEFDWGSVAFGDDDKSDELNSFGNWDQPASSTPAPTTSAAAPSSSTGDLGPGWSDMAANPSPFDSDLFGDSAPASAPTPEPTAASSSFGGDQFSEPVPAPSTGFYDDDDDDDDDENSSTIFPSLDAASALNIYDDDEEEDTSIKNILGEQTDLTDIDGIDASGEVKLDAEAEAFFAQIPDDITANKQTSGVSIISILLLILLNAGAGAAAFLQFSNM